MLGGVGDIPHATHNGNWSQNTKIDILHSFSCGKSSKPSVCFTLMTHHLAPYSSHLYSDPSRGHLPQWPLAPMQCGFDLGWKGRSGIAGDGVTVLSLVEDTSFL